MELSKPWNWAKNTQDIWHTPAEDVHYLVQRWQQQGFSRFLDLGCGLGRHACFFARHGFAVQAFDLSDEAVAQARAKAREQGLDIQVQAGDMHRLPYATASFDCLLAYHVISHTTSQGIGRIMEQINRVLRPGGEFFITLCSQRSWSFAEAGYPRHDPCTVIKVEDGPENGIPHWYADDAALRALCAANNLESVRLVQDQITGGRELRNSWHYFILGSTS